MNQMNTLWQIFSEKNLVSGEAPHNNTVSSPWYIQLLMAFSGWLAAIFILGFLAIGIEALLRDAMSSFIAGVILIVIAYQLLKNKQNDFTEHLALAISLAGQVLLYISSSHFEQPLFTWSMLMFMQILLTFLMPNTIHQFFSSYLAAYAFSFILTLLGMPHAFLPIVMFIMAYLWLHEFHYGKHIKKVQAVAYGLTLVLIHIKSTMVLHTSLFLWPYHARPIYIWFAPWLGTILSSAVVFYIAMQIFKNYKKTLNIAILIGSIFIVILLTLSSIQIPGLMLATIIILLGFNHSNHILIGLGIISLLSYISWYYYQLQITLLEKSILLFGMGVILLIVRWFIFHLLLKEHRNV